MKTDMQLVSSEKIISQSVRSKLIVWSTWNLNLGNTNLRVKHHLLGF